MKKFVPLLVVGTTLLAACDQNQPTDSQSTPAAVVNKADAVAEVNGQFIPKSALETLEKEIAERSHGQTFPKEKLIEELVQRELLIQDALKKKLDKSPEVIAQIQNAKNAILTQADLQNYIKSNPVTDEEIQAAYDSKIAGEKGVEYKASHILVKTEDEAKKLIDQLDKGADFAKLANKHSLDAKDSQNGGDLGWFAPNQMVAPFSEAVAALEKGKYSKEPVKTQFGYHIILNEDSRPITPPPLEAVKPQLTPFLQRKKVQGMIESLRKQAKVEILVPLKDETPKAEEAAKTGETPAAEKSAEEKPAVDEAAKPEGEDAPAEQKSEAAEPAKEEAASEEPATGTEEKTEAHEHEAAPAH